MFFEYESHKELQENIKMIISEKEKVINTMKSKELEFKDLRDLLL